MEEDWGEIIFPWSLGKNKGVRQPSPSTCKVLFSFFGDLCHGQACFSVIWLNGRFITRPLEFQGFIIEGLTCLVVMNGVKYWECIGVSDLVIWDFS